MSPHEERMVKEREELEVKISALSEFIITPVFRALDSIDKKLLNEQLGAMKNYSKILGWRIGRIKL